MQSGSAPLNNSTATGKRSRLSRLWGLCRDRRAGSPLDCDIRKASSSFTDGDDTPLEAEGGGVSEAPWPLTSELQQQQCHGAPPVTSTPLHGGSSTAQAAAASSPVTPDKSSSASSSGTKGRLLMGTLRRWRKENDQKHHHHHHNNNNQQAQQRSSVNSPMARNSAAASANGTAPNNAAGSLASLITQVEKEAKDADSLPHQQWPAPSTSTSSSSSVTSAPQQQHAGMLAVATPIPPSALASAVINELNCGPYLGPCLPQHIGRATLVLDLDETLVHSSFVEVPNYAFVIPVNIEGVVHAIYVAKRPGVDEFLRCVAQWYEVVVFTASLEKYASPLMDRLDPDRHCTYRLFRERCVQWNGQYVKDLTRLGREVGRVCIVDNSPNSYAFQPQNAVPISSWFDDIHDSELSELLPLLKELSSVASIPEAILTSLRPK